jgi:hypothetical protein
LNYQHGSFERSVGQVPDGPDPGGCFVVLILFYHFKQINKADIDLFVEKTIIVLEFPG